MQNESMPNVLIRDLPESVHRELLRRAEAAGKSLQRYLTEELTRLTSRPSLQDVLAHIEKRRGGRVGLARAVDDLAAERRRG